MTEEIFHIPWEKWSQLLASPLQKMITKLKSKYLKNKNGCVIVNIKCRICGHGWEFVGIYRPETTCPLCSGKTPVIFSQQPEPAPREIHINYMNDNKKEKSVETFINESLIPPFRIDVGGTLKKRGIALKC